MATQWRSTTSPTSQAKGDRDQIELGEARLLYGTWLTLKIKIMTPERIKYLNKMYGYGAADRINRLMQRFHKGELE